MTYHSLSCAGMCHSCKDKWKNLLIYLSVNFIPITVFYLLILVFQVKLTNDMFHNVQSANGVGFL